MHKRNPNYPNTSKSLGLEEVERKPPDELEELLLPEEVSVPEVPVLVLPFVPVEEDASPVVLFPLLEEEFPLFPVDGADGAAVPAACS